MVDRSLGTVEAATLTKGVAFLCGQADLLKRCRDARGGAARAKHAPDPAAALRSVGPLRSILEQIYGSPFPLKGERYSAERQPASRVEARDIGVYIAGTAGVSGDIAGRDISMYSWLAGGSGMSDQPALRGRRPPEGAAEFGGQPPSASDTGLVESDKTPIWRLHAGHLAC